MKSIEIPDDQEVTPEQFLAIRKDGLSFLACVKECSECHELVANVDRLYGTNILRRGAPINLMVDDATGKADADKQTFLRFVWNCIFIRVPVGDPLA